MRDLLRQQLDPRDGVTEDDGLVYPQLGEQGLEAMQLLALLNEGVVLCHAFQRQLGHDVDLRSMSNRKILFLERLDGLRECGREEEHLAVEAEAVLGGLLLLLFNALKLFVVLFAFRFKNSIRVTRCW